jgi:hypothetical protein
VAGAVERIVVQATAQEKQAIVGKARRLGMPVAELMRRGAAAYDAGELDEAGAELGALADAARAAAERAGSAIDDALDFIAASNRRLAALEADAQQARDLERRP